MSGAEAVEPGPVHEVGQQMRQFNDFMLGYKFAIDEVVTKIQILREDYNNAHDHNPIEHINSRLKSPDSILAKAQRKGQPVDLDSIRANILDIAGVRVTCCFLSDTYAVRDVIARQEDVRVLEERDYIAAPKANGYQSLHLIVEVPVYRAREVSRVPVEIQLRTIAMDFWASLEHRIYYKYGGAVPVGLVEDLTQAAAAVNSLDRTMQDLHQQVHEPQPISPTTPLAPPVDLFARYARTLGTAGDEGAAPGDPVPGTPGRD